MHPSKIDLSFDKQIIPFKVCGKSETSAQMDGHYTLVLTPGFIASNRAFNPLTCAFNLSIRVFNLVATRAFSLLTRGFELVTCGFELAIRALHFYNSK